MQLKYDKAIVKNVITISLETMNFTPEEVRALERYGEPEIRIEKSYTGGFSLSLLPRRLNLGSKLR